MTSHTRSRLWKWLLTLLVIGALAVGLSLGLPRAGEWMLLAAVVLAGVLAALVPGWRAYRLSLADGLSPRGV